MYEPGDFSDADVLMFNPIERDGIRVEVTINVQIHTTSRDMYGRIYFETPSVVTISTFLGKND
ncbi:MAG: hypothetical protein V1862_08200 [Methanobacteriota archaeon]